MAGRGWPGAGQGWPGLARGWPRLARAGPGGPGLARADTVGPGSKIRSINRGRIMENILAPRSPKEIATSGPGPPKKRPYWPGIARAGQSWPGAGQGWPGLARAGQGLARAGQGLARGWPGLARADGVGPGSKKSRAPKKAKFRLNVYIKVTQKSIHPRGPPRVGGVGFN